MDVDCMDMAVDLGMVQETPYALIGMLLFQRVYCVGY